MKGKIALVKFLIIIFLIFSLAEHSFSQNIPVGEGKVTEYNVFSLDWKIWGYRSRLPCCGMNILLGWQ